MNQLAEMLIGRLAPGRRPAYAPAQAGELRYSVANIASAQRNLGYAPTRTIEHDLNDVILTVRKTVV